MILFLQVVFVVVLSLFLILMPPRAFSKIKGFDLLGTTFSWIGFWMICFLVWFFTYRIVNYEENPPEPPSVWDGCVYQARGLYDQFNDTVSASYAHADEPSKEVQEFIKLCLEEKGNERFNNLNK